MKGYKALGFFVVTAFFIALSSWYMICYHYTNFAQFYVFDHYIAGLLCPYYFWLLGRGNIKFYGAFYAVFCLGNESYEAYRRGFFQYNQLAAGILGVFTLILLFKIFSNITRRRMVRLW